MKKTSRALALILALLMMLLVFAGCGGGAKETEAPSTETNSPESPATEAPDATDEPTDETGDEGTHPYPISFPLCEDPVEFSLWTTINPMATTYIDQLTDAAVYTYLNELTNVHCVAESISSMQARDQFPLMVNSGEWPDMVERTSELYSGGMNNAYLEEFIIDLTAAVAEFSPNYYSRLNEDPVRMLGATGGTGEEILTFAEIWDEFTNMNSGLGIRKDWLDELEMDVPQTYDELEAVLKAFKTEKGADSPMWLSPYGNGGGQTLTGGYGISIVLDTMGGSHPFYAVDGVVECGFKAEGLKDYIAMMSSWFEQGLIYKDFMAESFAPTMSFSQGAYADFLNGKIGVGMLAVDDFVEIESQGLGVIGMADVTKNAGDTVGIMDLTPATSPGWCITSACPVEKIPYICQWMDYLYTDEGAITNSFGLEGEAWDYDADGNIAFNDLMINNPDNLSWKVLLTLYSIDTGPGYFLNARNTVAHNETQHNAIDTWFSNQDGSNAYFTGAVLSQEEQAEYGEIIAQLETYAKSTILNWIIGSGDVEADWDQYIETLDELNVDRATELKQAAYDRYIEFLDA